MSLGIDIGSKTVAFVEMKGRGPDIVKYGYLPLDEGSVRDGEIVDTTAVANTIKRMLEAAKVKERKVHLGVSNQRVFIRQHDIDYIPEKELEASLRYQLDDVIPVPLDEVEIDFHVVDDNIEEDGKRRMRLMIAAGVTSMLNNYVEVGELAGLSVESIDVDAVAVLRALTGGEGTAATAETQIIVDVGAALTNIVVQKNGFPLFTRTIVGGGNAITAAVKNEKPDLTTKQAEKEKEKTQLNDASDPVVRAIAQQVENLVNEIKTSIEAYMTRSTSSDRPTKILLTGGSSLQRGLKTRLAERTRLPVEIGNPLDHWSIKMEISPENVAKHGPLLATAVGLALGGSND